MATHRGLTKQEIDNLTPEHDPKQCKFSDEIKEYTTKFLEIYKIQMKPDESLQSLFERLLEDEKLNDEVIQVFWTLHKAEDFLNRIKNNDIKQEAEMLFSVLTELKAIMYKDEIKRVMLAGINQKEELERRGLGEDQRKKRDAELQKAFEELKVEMNKGKTNFTRPTVDQVYERLGGTEMSGEAVKQRLKRHKRKL